MARFTISAAFLSITDYRIAVIIGEEKRGFCDSYGKVCRFCRKFRICTIGFSAGNHLFYWNGAKIAVPLHRQSDKPLGFAACMKQERSLTY